MIDGRKVTRPDDVSLELDASELYLRTATLQDTCAETHKHRADTPEETDYQPLAGLKRHRFSFFLLCNFFYFE